MAVTLMLRVSDKLRSKHRMSVLWFANLFLLGFNTQGLLNGLYDGEWIAATLSGLGVLINATYVWFARRFAL